MYPKQVILLFSIAALLLTVPGLSKAQTEVQQLTITQIEGGQDQFPAITLRLRVTDEAGLPVTGLSPDDLAVTENGSPIPDWQGPTLVEDSGLWIHFIINAGFGMRGNNLDNTKAGIRSFLEDPNLKLEADQVALSAVDGLGILSPAPFTTDAGTVRSALENTSPCNVPQCALPFASVDDLLLEDKWPGAGNQPKIIIYFTPLIEDERFEDRANTANASDIAALGEQAKNEGITIYTVVVDNSLQNNKLANLAEASGGQAIAYSNLNSLYAQIANRFRPQYELSYRNTNGTLGTRTVRVTYGAEGNIVGTAAYDVAEISEPGIDITSPEEDSTISQESGASGPKIMARVIFVNYGARQLRSAKLLIDGELAADPIENPDPSGFEFDFPWDMIEGPGRIKLEIEVTDELGNTGTKSQSNMVVPLPVVEPTVVPTEPVEEGAPEPEEPETVPTSVPSTDGGLTTVLLISIVALAGVMAFLVLNRDKTPVQNVRSTIMRGVDRLTRRYQRQTEVKAYLIVLAGDASEGKHLEVYGTTTIGRSNEDADLAFQQHTENSPISRRQCTILDEEDHFKIRDEDSANGTYLNGVRLPAMEPRELYDGDEIELARVERGGVRLRFQSTQTVYESSVPAATDFDEFDAHQTRRVRKQQAPGKRPGDRF